MLLIVGSPGEAHAAAVRAEAGRRRWGAAVLDFADFPARGRLAWPVHDGSGRVVGEGGALDLEDVSAVYWRSAGVPRAPAGLQRSAHAFAARETLRALEALVAELPCPIVNPPAAVHAHRHKPRQSRAVAALGVPVPDTLVSNDPDAVAEFAAAHPEGVVVKPVTGGAHARRLVPADLGRHESIRACPMQYQALLPGEEVRAYVIEGEVFAATIVRSRPGPVDFRQDPGHRCAARTLDPGEAAACQRIAAALGLRFTGLDFRCQADGALCFLEANPSPMFLRFQADTGHPLLGRLVDLLAPPAR